MKEETVEVIIGDERYRFSTKDLAINRDDLDGELARQAALFAWYGFLHERLRAERSRLELELEELTAQIDQEVRRRMHQEAPEGRGLKPTEAEIKSRVRITPTYVNASRKILKVEADERMLSVIVSALAQRKDMLVALARNRHLEMAAPSADEVERMKRHLLGRT